MEDIDLDFLLPLMSPNSLKNFSEPDEQYPSTSAAALQLQNQNYEKCPPRPIPPLPPELWQLILSNINDPHTLLRCTRTCVAWNDLLAKEKPKFLFQLVLPTLVNHASRNDILKCRMICSSWKDTIDTYRQARPFSWDPSFRDELVVNGLEPLDRGSYMGHSTFYLASHFVKFLSDTKDHNGNPFPSRAVIFECFWDDMDAYQGFVAMLKKFGEHIWTLIYICHDDLPFGAEYIQHIFENCRNLKSMSLYMLNSWGREGAREGLLWLSDEALPRLPYLVSLNISGSRSELIAEKLLEAYGNQLEHLECNEEVITAANHFSHKGMYQEIRVLPRLKTLKIRNYNRYYLDVLYKLSFFRVPAVERMSLQFLENWTDKIPLRSLIRAINPFAASLEELHIPLQYKQVQLLPTFYNTKDLMEIEREMGLQFPRLKTLGMSYSFAKYPVMDKILRKFKSLKKLQFHSYGLSRREDERDERERRKSEELWTGSRMEMGLLLERFWRIGTSLEEISVWCRHTHTATFTFTKEEYEEKVNGYY